MIKPFLPSSFELYGLTFYTYGLIISLALLIYYQLLERDKLVKLKFNEFLIFLVGILIGARALHIVNEIEYYSKFPDKILEISSGGIAFFGGMIGGLVSIYLISYLRKTTWIKLIDRFALYLPLIHAIGRFGNFFNNELYGRPSDLPWAIYIPLKDRLNGFENFETFHPTFLYESLLNLFLFAALMKFSLNKDLKKGDITAIYLIGYGTIRIIMMNFRIDRGYIFGFESAILFSILSIIAGLLILSKHKKNIKN